MTSMKTKDEMQNKKLLSDSKQDNRIYLNIVRGVAVFLMLWGHVIQCCANGTFDFFEDSVFKFIYSFHMPLFMLISGYLFFFSCSKRSLSSLLIHRTQSLFQPIVMCSILNYYLTIVLSQRTLSSMVDGPWINMFSTLWFLWSVLSASIAVGLTIKLTNNSLLRLLLLCVGFGFVYLFPNSTMNLYMYPFFVLGFLFAENKDRLPSVMICLVKCVSLPLFPVMLLFYEKKHYIYTTGIIPNGNTIEQIIIDGFRWTIGLVGSIFVLVILEYLYKQCKQVFLKKTGIVKPLSHLGMKSLQVYCLSVSLLSFWLPKLHNQLCSVLGGNRFASNMLMYDFVYTPLVAILYAIIICCIVRMMEKTKVNRIIFWR